MQESRRLPPHSEFLCVIGPCECAKIPLAAGGLCRLSPRLKGVREELIDGKYTLVLEFLTRKEMTR